MNQLIFKFEGREQTIPLDKDVISMGRNQDNTIVVRTEKVSRHHCEIRKSGDNFTVVDLDSRNGTFVNGEKIKEKLLGPGDKISVGEATIIFESEEAVKTVVAPETSAPEEAAVFQEDEIKPPAPAVKQIIFKHDGCQETIPLDKEILSFGRSQDNNIVIRSEKVSRQHCEIRKSGDHFTVVDLDSHNGIFVDGEKIKEKVLKTGDKILIGDAIIIFEQELPDKPAALPAGVLPKALSSDEFVNVAPKSAKGLISAVIISLIILAGVIYWISQRMDGQINLDQSLLASNASFEVVNNSGEAVDWVVPESIKKNVKVVSTEKQKGEKSLLIEKTAPENDIYNGVKYKKQIKSGYGSGRPAYTFGGWVKSDALNKSFAGYKLAWFKEGESVPLAENYTELVYSPNQWQLLSATATPPPQASYSNFYCVSLARSAKTYFDNTFINKSASQPPALAKPEIGDQNLKIVLLPGGIWRLEQKDSPILLQGEMAINSGGVISRQSFGGKSTVVVQEGGSNIKFEGQLVHPETLNWIKLQLDMRALPTISLDYSIEPPANTAKPQLYTLTFQLPLEKARQKMRLITSSQIKEKSYFEEINEDDIAELNMELPDKILAIKYSRPIRLQVIRRAETLEFIQALAQDTTGLKIEFNQKPLLADSIPEMEKALNKADEHEKQNLLVKAMEIYNDIMRQVDRKHEIYQRSFAKLTFLKDKAVESLKEITEVYTFAHILSDSKLYTEADSRARQIIKSYKGTEYEKEAQKIVDRIETERKDKNNSITDTNAKKILALADNCLKENKTETAIWLYKRLIEIERYRGTTEAEEARKKLAEMENIPK